MIDFEHLILLEKQEKVADGAGGYKVKWVDFKEVYANVQPISGDSYIKAQQYQSKINYKVFMEFDNEINSTLRVRYDNKILTIKAPINQGGLDEILVLMCEGSDVK